MLCRCSCQWGKLAGPEAPPDRMLRAMTPSGVTGVKYCTLFVDAEHRDDPDFFPDVDERRPPENMD